MVLAGILACQNHLPSPLGPLTTSISALRTGAAPQASSWWTWAPAAHSQCLYLQAIRPSQVLYTLSDERSAPQLQSFLVGGRASSTASDRQHAHQPSLHVSITRAPPYILFLGPYTSVYYAHVITMSWLVVGSQVKAKMGNASGNTPYSTNARTDTGGKFQLLAWAFHTAATVIN